MTSPTRNVVVRFIGDVRSLDDINGRFQAIGQTISGIGLLAGAAFAGKAIKAASDLGETVSKVGQIFGQQAAPQLQAFAQNAAKSLGQSQQSALDAVATFGVFAKSAGMSGQAAVDFSTQMTSLASDLASFNNTSPEQAIEAIGAALRGEAEPIRAYGVLLDDATLKNRALKMGLIQTTTEALTPQQRVLAAQQEILAQTTLAQGDFQRTQGGLANQTRILKAEFENFTAQIGGYLVPIILSAINFFNQHRNIVIALGIAVAGITAIFVAHTIATKALAVAKDILTVAEWALNTAVVKNIIFYIQYAAVSTAMAIAHGAVRLATIATTVAQWALNAAMNANPIMLIVTLLGLLVGAFIWAWTHSETFRNILINAWNAVRNALKAAWDFIYQNVILPYIVTFQWMMDKATDLKNWIIDRFREWINWIRDRIADLVNIGRDLINGIKNGMLEVANKALDWIKDIGNAIINAVKRFFGINSPSTVFFELGGHMIQGLINGLLSRNPIEIVKSVFGSMDDALSSLVSKNFIQLGSIQNSDILAKIAAKLGQMFGGGGIQVSGLGGGVQRWAGVTLQAMTMLGIPPHLLGIILRRMQQESGGNQFAVNNWDINAKRGTPSMGLMQTIGPTFNAYAGPLRGLGIFNPLANIYAGLNYAMHRYGGIPGLIYAMNKPGGYKHGGWLMPGELAFNETREPEAILNRRQWNALERDRQGGNTYVVNNYGADKIDRDDIRRYIQELEALAGL